MRAVNRLSPLVWLVIGPGYFSFLEPVALRRLPSSVMAEGIHVLVASGHSLRQLPRHSRRGVLAEVDAQALKLAADSVAKRGVNHVGPNLAKARILAKYNTVN
jgi:hypothetical protein